MKLRSFGVKLRTNAADLRPGAAGAFDPKKAEVLIRDKTTTRYIAEHETGHAKQFHELGRDADAYLNMSKVEREKYVFRHLMKCRKALSLSPDEIEQAKTYIRNVVRNADLDAITRELERGP